MNLQKFLRRAGGAAFLAAGSLAAASTAFGQAKATLIVHKSSEIKPIAGRTNLYCAGYVQTAPINTSNSLIGALEEQDGFNY